MEKGELPLVKDNVIKKPSPQMWQHRIETTPDQPQDQVMMFEQEKQHISAGPL